MANPVYGTFPNAQGWQGLSSFIKLGLAINRVNQAEFADQVNLNGRFDWVDRIYRGDLLSPQFLLRPIIRRAANSATGTPTTATGTNAIRAGVVTEIPNPNGQISPLDRVRNNAR